MFLSDDISIIIISILIINFDNLAMVLSSFPRQQQELFIAIDLDLVTGVLPGTSPSRGRHSSGFSFKIFGFEVVMEINKLNSIVGMEKAFCYCNGLIEKIILM